MSQSKDQMVREAIDAFNRRDFDAAIAGMTDDITWDPFLSRTETEAPLQGKEQILAAWKSQTETVGLRVEPQEVICLGADKVLADAQMVMRGRSSEVDLVASVIWLFTMPDDLVQKVELFETREEAMAAASAPGP